MLCTEEQDEHSENNDIFRLYVAKMIPTRNAMPRPNYLTNPKSFIYSSSWQKNFTWYLHCYLQPAPNF